ncbi:MAG TPA: mannosyltransferase family protein, partial [Vicinamibacteria bacterium]|nr:mannosyltransferase family protein [Vicinamibacteria bacterium]
VHYLRIAREGYSQQHLSVFLPFYPLLVRAATVPLRQPVAAALAVSLLAHLGAAWCLARLLLLDHPPEVVERAVLFLAVFPAALFAGAPYTESTFLFLVTAALLCFRRRRMVLAGVLASLAVCTRLPGLALVAGLAAESLFGRHRPARLRTVLFPLAFPLLGVAVYLLINARVFGDPFFFLDVQRHSFYRSFALPFPAAAGALSRAWSGPWPTNLTAGIDEVVGAALAVAATVYAFRRMRVGDAVYCLGATLMFTCSTFWSSNLRYCFVLFPLYVMLAQAGRRPEVRWPLAALSALWLAVLSIQFARGHWAA